MSRQRHGPTNTEDVPTSGVVAIVGRPNVGKSTLFNRLTGDRSAIVDEASGLTRDRLYGIVEWQGRGFTLVDTAGIDTRPLQKGEFVELTQGAQEQARVAIEEADVCCHVVDIREGVTALDEEVAAVLRTGGKPVLLVGNKADTSSADHFTHELYRLGLGDPIIISATQGTDTGELLDRIIDALPPQHESAPVGATADMSVAIIGRPNVGKSSILNALVRKERALVSAIPGTTRDSVDSMVQYDDKVIRLVDTAGIRRRGVVSTDVEHYSVLRALRALSRCDVAVVVIDAAAGIVAQDRHIAGYAADAGKGVVIVANKWDLVSHDDRMSSQFLKQIAAAFSFVPGVPVVTTSATEGRHLPKILDAAWQVARARSTRIPTPALNNLVRSAIDEHPPRIHKGKRLKILYAAQARTATPTVVLFVNEPQLLHFAFSRYLENRIRAVFGFSGVRLRIIARRRGEGV